MPRCQKSFTMALIVPFLFLLPVGVQASTIPPFEVLSLRVEKAPSACRSTLFVTIRNNTQTVSNSGLFVHAAQFKDLGNGQKISASIGSLRLDNLPAGQSREVSYTFLRDRLKTGASFRFKIVAETIAYTEKPLPPLLEQYSGNLENVVYDQAHNVLTGSVTNQGSFAIPRPVVSVYLASPDKPDTYEGGGGGMVMECLAPGDRKAFTRPMLPEAAESVIRVVFSVDGTVLDTQFHGRPPAMKSKTMDKRAPKVKKEMKTIKP